MSRYYKHTHTVTQNIPYMFKCEHCHQDSGTLTALFKAESTRNKMTKKDLKEQEKDQMNQEAMESLNKSLQKAQEDAKNEEYGEIFSDKCPHCGKPQSWAIKGMSVLPSTYGVMTGFLALIICVGGNIFDLTSFSLFGGLKFVVVSVLIGVAIGLIRIENKKRLTKNVNEKQVPRIDWSVIE